MVHAVEVIDSIAAPLIALTFADGDSATGAWLLGVDGEVVSTVMTFRVDDAVTVWSMVTPAGRPR